MARPAAEIQSDLTAAYAARLAALKAQSYSEDSGQSRLSAARANLTEINNTIDRLQTELAEAQDPTGGIMHIQVDR